MFQQMSDSTKYIDFLKYLDSNYKSLTSEVDKIWQILLDNYIISIEDETHVTFKQIYGAKDDSTLYRNFLSNYGKSETLLNYLIRVGFVEKDIIRSDNFENFKYIKLDTPETIVFTKDYMKKIKKDWQDIEKLINDLNASLIFYGFKKKGK